MGKLRAATASLLAATVISPSLLVGQGGAVVNAVTLQGPFISNVPTPERRDRLLTRLQWVPRRSDTLNLRYSMSDQSRENSDVGGFNLPAQGASTGRHKHELVLNYSTTLSGNSSNDLTFRIKKEDERTGNRTGSPALVVKQAFIELGFENT